MKIRHNKDRLNAEKAGKKRDSEEIRQRQMCVNKKPAKKQYFVGLVKKPARGGVVFKQSLWTS